MFRQLPEIGEKWRNPFPGVPTWIVSLGLETWHYLKAVIKTGCLTYLKHYLWHDSPQMFSHVIIRFCTPSCMIGLYCQMQIRWCLCCSSHPIYFSSLWNIVELYHWSSLPEGNFHSCWQLSEPCSLILLPPPSQTNDQWSLRRRETHT